MSEEPPFLVLPHDRHERCHASGSAISGKYSVIRTLGTGVNTINPLRTAASFKMCDRDIYGKLFLRGVEPITCVLHEMTNKAIFAGENMKYLIGRAGKGAGRQTLITAR